MAEKNSQTGSAWKLVVVFVIVVFGTGAALHRERALFGETTGSTALLTQAVEELTYSAPFSATGGSNFARDPSLRRRSIASRSLGNSGTDFGETSNPITTPITTPTQSLLDRAPLAITSSEPGASQVIPLGSGPDGPALSFSGTPAQANGSGGGGSIVSTTPDPGPPPPDTPDPTPPVGIVPEPVTWTMMILGFALIGGAMRRRNADRLANGVAIAV